MSKRLKTRSCDRTVARERLQAALSYFETAETAAGIASANDQYRWSSQTTNYVHSGIAAADAVCCAVLGEHSQGDDHRQAIELLRRVTPGGDGLANDLATLLGMKTRAGYGSSPLAKEHATRARRSAERLITDARARVSG